MFDAKEAQKMDVLKLLGKGVSVADFNALLAEAGLGNVDQIVKIIEDNANNLRKQSANQISEAGAVETTAAKVFDEETRDSRKKLQSAKDKAQGMRVDATLKANTAKNKAALVAKFK